MLLAATHNLWRSLPYVLLFTFQPLLICILILISLHQFPGGGELSLSDQNGFSAVRWVKPVGFGFCRNVITWNNNSFCLCVLVYVNKHPNPSFTPAVPVIWSVFPFWGFDHIWNFRSSCSQIIPDAGRPCMYQILRSVLLGLFMLMFSNPYNCFLSIELPLWIFEF